MLPALPVRKDRRLAARAAPAGSDRLDLLTAGRPELRRSMLATAPLLRAGELDGIVRSSRRYGDLTRRLAARLLAEVPPPTRALLGFAALLGVGHPRLASLAPVLETGGHLPWWTECTDGWRRFEPVWRDAVHAACRTDDRPEVVLLGRLLAELTEAGAAGAAIERCLDAGYTGTASDLLAGSAEDLLASDRPLALARWLRRLPRADRRRGVLAAQLRVARRAGRRGAPPVPARPAAAVGGALPDRRSVRVARADRSVPAALADRRAVRAPADRGSVPAPEERAEAAAATLDVRLLGDLDVRLGGRQVETWHGRKGALLLAYLLLHRDRTIARDALAVEFWPDALPGASRNRLHVAMHALRADLQAVSTVPVVLFDHGYGLNHDLRVRLDTETFDSALARGELADDGGDPDTALGAYRGAVDCYRGDLLSEHPYEDWTLLPRQHYRVRLLDALGRGAHLEFDAGRYAESAAHARRLLELDFFREDLHRLLMRSYCRLGRPHLALRQFDECSRQLIQELGIEPASETVDLCRRVRERASV